MGRYVVREDVAVADCALEIEGRDLGDLFETAARAVAELMVDPGTVATAIRREIALAATALDLLFFDWIAELIFLKDSEQLIVTETSAAVEAPGTDPAAALPAGAPCRLTACVAGGPIDREQTTLRADAKAPTLYRLAVEPTADGWRASVVIDI